MISRDAVARFGLRRVSLILLSVVFSLAAQVLPAQNQNYGAPFLLFPIGAHAVGLSDAVVADSSLGSEGIWWNPASMARMRKRELAIHHAQTFSAASDLLSFVFPSKTFGTFAAAANIVNYGDGEAKDSTGAVIGNTTSRNYLLVASYATPIGKQLSLGISAKLVLLRFGCSGCPFGAPSLVGSTNAIDLGVQYSLHTRLPITLGASLRNLGQPLQVKDAEQADPLPRVIQFGARVRVPIAALDSNDTSLDILGDVFSSPAYSGPSIRFGAALTYSKDYVLRVGYKSPAGSGDNSNGLSVGLGLAKGAFAFDFARRFDATSGLGAAPTYVSLRFIF